MQKNITNTTTTINIRFIYQFKFIHSHITCAVFIFTMRSNKSTWSESRLPCLYSFVCKSHSHISTLLWGKIIRIEPKKIQMRNEREMKCLITCSGGRDILIWRINVWWNNFIILKVKWNEFLWIDNLVEWTPNESRALQWFVDNAWWKKW